MRQPAGVCPRTISSAPWEATGGAHAAPRARRRYRRRGDDRGHRAYGALARLLKAQTAKYAVELVLGSWPANAHDAAVGSSDERGRLVTKPGVVALDAIARLRRDPAQAAPPRSTDAVGGYREIVAAQHHPGSTAPLKPAHWGVIPHPLRNDLHQDRVEVDAIVCGKSLLPIPGTHREATRILGIGSIGDDFPVGSVGERDLAATARERRVGLLRQGVVKPCEEEAKKAEWETNRPLLGVPRVHPDPVSV